MDSIQTNSHKQDDYILKSNLWKFFKTLRAQANPIYCLFMASPIAYAWVTIIDKMDSTIHKRISIAQFINTLKKMPSTSKYYRLSINSNLSKCPYNTNYHWRLLPDYCLPSSQITA